MKKLLIAIIRIYQALHGIFFHRCCRFQPSCSQYAIEAIQLHGAIYGTFLTGMRLIRCHPLCRGGWDPVPGPLGGKRHG